MGTWNCIQFNGMKRFRIKLYEQCTNRRKTIPNEYPWLTKYINKVAEDSMKDLKECSPDDRKSIRMHWARLEVTLTSIILFNRRRQGEASKMNINDYSKGVNNEHSSDSINELSKFEKALCQTLTRIEITGKRGMLVPVLLTVSMKASVEMLIAERQKMDIPTSNTFVFARINNDSNDHIRGSDVLRKLANEVPLKHPECITSTLLRKHIATMTQLLNLKDNELDLIAQFMGHDIRIHREHYRLPSSTMQVAKVSKLLLAMEKGSISLEEAQNADNLDIDDVIEEDDTNNGVQSEDSEDESGPNVDAGDEDYNAVSTRQGLRQAVSSCSSSHTVRSSNPQSSTAMRDMTGRRKWRQDEETACLRHFQRSIALQKLPGKSAIEKCQQQEPLLQDRTWVQIKNFVRNHIKKICK